MFNSVGFYIGQSTNIWGPWFLPNTYSIFAGHHAEHMRILSHLLFIIIELDIIIGVFFFFEFSLNSILFLLLSSEHNDK